MQHRTLDDLIAECQGMADKAARTKNFLIPIEPPPMQSFESGPPRWMYVLFFAAAGTVGLIFVGMLVWSLFG